ncbi:hypothetical protein R6Q59_024263 [Mikania micrantha]
MAAQILHFPTSFTPITTNRTYPLRTLLPFKPLSLSFSHKPFRSLCLRYIPNQISDRNNVRIFDTTLRDGDQPPAATMTTKEKLDIVRQLPKLGVEFSPEDAGRSEREFLYEMLGEVIKAGATTLNIPDTVGYNGPREFGHLIADIKSNTPGIENVIISAHCQNDLALSTANTLEGAYNGARQSEVTINGIGERPGNASLEEMVMTLKCKGELFGGLYTGINTRHIVMASKMVEEYSGLQVQPHKAIVGANAFAHESGIHQDVMLKNKSAYEIMSPEDIGLFRSNESGLTLGKLSGRHGLKSKLLELGFDIDGRELTDDDLIALVSDEGFQPKVVWKFGDVQDLMLGVAFLNTPEAVAAAESAIASSQPIISLDDDSCIDEKSQRGKLMGSDGLIVGPRPKPNENYIEYRAGKIVNEGSAVCIFRAQMDPRTQQPTRCNHSPLPTSRYIKPMCWRALNRANLHAPQEKTCCMVKPLLTVLARI